MSSVPNVKRSEREMPRNARHNASPVHPCLPSAQEFLTVLVGLLPEYAAARRSRRVGGAAYIALLRHLGDEPRYAELLHGSRARAPSPHRSQKVSETRVHGDFHGDFHRWFLEKKEALRECFIFSVISF